MIHKLCWPESKSNTNRRKTSISNRVSEIQRLSKVNSWHYVKSTDNPADLIALGLSASYLLNNKWW